MNRSKRQPNQQAKEEIIATLRKFAEKLGCTPSLAKLKRESAINMYQMRMAFGTYTQALIEAGLEGKGAGYPVPMETLFREWAGIARKVGRVPTITDYQMYSRYSSRPLTDRFGGRSWKNVATGLAAYAEKNGLEGEWKDVLDIVAEREKQETKENRTSSFTSNLPFQAVLRKDRPTFGASLNPLPMAHAPTNEQGVVFLFGMLAAQLGFVVLRLQTEFPDCRAMRRVDEDVWQETVIELEFESRNFLAHGHDLNGCDMIVCWRHNWPECPLEVVELRKVLGGVLSNQQSAFNPVRVK